MKRFKDPSLLYGRDKGSVFALSGYVGTFGTGIKKTALTQNNFIASVLNILPYKTLFDVVQKSVRICTRMHKKNS